MKSFIKKANRPEEIKSVLLSALAQEKVFTVWQRDEENNLAFNIKAKLDTIDEFGNLRFIILDEAPDLSEAEVFFAIEDSTVVFKTDSVQVKGNKMRVDIPKEASYRERRRHKRTYYKLKDHKDIELIFENIFDIDDQEPIVIKSKILDLSESGACFIVSKNTLTQIDPELLFEIKSLSDLRLSSTKAKIMNARKYPGRKLHQEELYVVGVMFC